MNIFSIGEYSAGYSSGTQSNAHRNLCKNACYFSSSLTETGICQQIAVNSPNKVLIQSIIEPESPTRKTKQQKKKVNNN
jgi:hypothetical protein